jgi:hypothetical protein
MTVAFEELEGSPLVRIAEQGTAAERLFRTAWDDWPALASELIGSYATVGREFVFSPPIEFPGMPNLVAAEIAIEPLDGGRPEGDEASTLTSGTNKYPHAGALVRAVYRTAFDADNMPRRDMPAVPEGTYLTFASGVSTRFHTIRGRVWHWVDPPTNAKLTTDVNPGVLIATGETRLAWRRVPLPPWDAIRRLRGTVNDSPFLGSPEQSVLFLGAKATRHFQFASSGGFWTVEYEFRERTLPGYDGAIVGWNREYRETPLDGEHWIAIADDSGNPPYRLGDFSELFQFPSR